MTLNIQDLKKEISLQVTLTGDRSKRLARNDFYKLKIEPVTSFKELLEQLQDSQISVFNKGWTSNRFHQKLLAIRGDLLKELAIPEELEFASWPPNQSSQLQSMH